jgi:predicted nucleic acid-binding protein
MIAVDSSTIIAFIQGDSGTDVDKLDAALAAGTVAISPVALTELLSESRLPQRHENFIRSLPLLEIHDGYWIRAAKSRAAILSQKLRARLPDTLIAQAAIDHDLALIQRDGDFRHFAKHCGLKLA